MSCSRSVGAAVAVVLLSLSSPSLVAAQAEVGSFPPDQPYISFWFPNELLDWTPDSDPDAPYNRATVPLAERFENPRIRVNSNARAGEGRITSLAVMYPSTSFNPSQGSADFDVYAFSYWQYLDSLVFFGGSAGEGLILAPNPGVTNSGHRNGVPVLGNIFFPPNVFGGDIQWVRDLVQRDGETFPVADKLIEVAEYYGFDGWFINQETSGGNAELAADMRDFLRYIQDQSSLQMQWYDSMDENGLIAYQNRLNSRNDAFLQENDERVSDGIFLNYNWSSGGLNESRDLAIDLDRSPYVVFAGADVGNSGYNSFVNWSSLWPDGDVHKVSLGLFGSQWTFSSSNSPEEFYDNASRFWVGENRDPSNTETPDDWKGLANYVPAKSPVMSVPFVTHFNTGQGFFYTVDGETLSNIEWNNRSLQDVLPTWRWSVRAPGGGPVLTPSLSFDDAYNGGSSLEVAGSFGSTQYLPLYKTQLPLAGGDQMTLAFKTGEAGLASRLSVGLAFEDGNGLAPFVFLPAGDAQLADWNLRTFDLSEYAGETVAAIAL